MSRRRPHTSEIIGRVYQSSTEMMLPNAIDDRTPGQRMIGSSDPSSERCATVAFGVIRQQVEVTGFRY